jgi:hypothetical protein
MIFQPNLPNFSDQVTRDLLRSVALGPLGAWTRWGLTRLPWIKASWPEMNPQTMTANFIGVIVMIFIFVFAPTWSWANAFNNGFFTYIKTIFFLNDSIYNYLVLFIYFIIISYFILFISSFFSFINNLNKVSMVRAALCRLSLRKLIHCTSKKVH